MKIKNILHKIAWIIAALFLALFACFESALSTASAEEDGIMDLDTTQIEWDLQDIDSDDYPKDADGQHELIRFMEYCYSDSAFFKSYYGLYLYVYNPTERAVKTDGGLNVANMAVSYNSNGEPSEYDNVVLTHLDSTSNNRFLKFKVENSSAFLTRAKEYAAAHDGQRRYDIVGIQLYFYDGTTVKYEDRTVAKSYVWTGFAKGCGSDYNAASTLKCESQTEDTLSLNVKSTYYRPEGNNGTNEYTQDCLHSVYFAVPNKFIEKYGEISKIHASWLEAVLKPALVTGNADAYETILPFLGYDLNASAKETLSLTTRGDEATIGDYIDYIYLGASVGGDSTSTHLNPYGYSYNYEGRWVGNSATRTEFGETVNPLYMLFYSGGGEESADEYIVSSQKIIERMATSYAKFGGEAVYGANAVYSSYIFDSIAEEKRDEEIKGTTEYVLENQVLDQSWWQKWLGISNYESSPFDGIKAIQKVTESDLTREPTVDSKALYIAEPDCENFYRYFDENKSDSTIYLFRYRKSEYISQEASLYEPKITALGVDYWGSDDTNAYFFQQAVDLNFDIIDVTFFDGVTETVIPVVMSPMDIVHDATPPIETTSDADDDWLETLKKIFGYILISFVVLVVVLPIVVVLLPYVIKFVIWLVCLPFKLLGAMFKGIGKLFKRKKK